MSAAHYSRVAERACHRCEYCRAPESVFNFAFEVEHVLPSSKKGSDDETNEALACRSCNLFKSDRTVSVDPETGNEVALFNPRKDRWEEHFRIDVESCTIVGLTATGRATIERLQMNSPMQIAGRRFWIQLGLFP